MADRTHAAIRTAEHRLLFQRAVRDNITMAEAKRRIAEERWHITDAHLAQRRGADHPTDQEARPEQPWMMRD